MDIFYTIKKHKSRGEVKKVADGAPVGRAAH